jgi:hypothetical protein
MTVSLNGTDGPGGPRQSAGRRRRLRWLSGTFLTAVVVVPGTWIAGHRAERDGLAFYEAGRATVACLAGLGEALEARDARAVEDAFAAGVSGRGPGLAAAPVLASRQGGVESFRFRPSGTALDRQGMVEAWWRYLEGFEELETVELHLHRLESWGGEIVGTARFEAIGTPRGAPRAAVDRALLRVRLGRDGAAGDSRLRIRHLELVAGERIAAERPGFAEVGEAAGIAFENRYYPPFLSEPLAFGMIRHGPGGITAADYDGDGLSDLFVPDGVASRLLRNRGDGTFEDVTAAAGLAGLAGVSVALFADVDGDGWRDLFVSRTFEPNQLFRSNGPRSDGDSDGGVTFTDVTAASGIGADCCTTVASFADVDNDGDLDLYVGRYLDPREQIPTTFYARNGEPNRLYRNEGDGTFTDVTDEAGVGDPGLCLGSAFGDLDDDGWPDLWVANDFGRKTLYRNRGDGSFDDVTAATGTLAYGAGMSSTIGDYDNDGRLDLYVAHIRSEHSWYAEAPTVKRYMLNSFRQGVWWTDMPLYFEIFRQSGTRFVEVFQQMASGNTLLRNRGPQSDGDPDGATFEDTTLRARANPPGWFWGTSFADFDNDGWLDLYAANGCVYGEPDSEIELEFLNDVVSRQDVYKTGILFDPEHFAGRSWHGWERNRHLRNNRDGTFTEIGRAAGTDLLLNSRGIAVADFWNRGVQDVAVAASADRHALLANLGSGRDGAGGWLQVEAVGAGGALPDGTNRDGVGARITLTAGGLTQTREVVLGDGYGSQNSLRQHFGLGGARRIERLAVRWPRSGRVQTFRDLEPGRIVRVTEGRDELEEVRYPSAAPPLAEDRDAGAAG